MTTRRSISAFSAALAIALAMTAGGCSSGSDSNGGDADDLKEQLTDAFENSTAFQDALYRLAVAVNGGEQDGVDLTTTETGITGSVQAYVDGTGPSATTINGALTYITPANGLAGGANLDVTSIDGGAPQTAHGSAVVTQTGPAVLQFTDASFTTHTDTRGNDLTLSNGNLEVDATDVDEVEVAGDVDFNFNDLEGVLTFEPDGLGGYQIRVSGSGFDSFVVGAGAGLRR